MKNIILSLVCVLIMLFSTVVLGNVTSSVTMETTDVSWTIYDYFYGQYNPYATYWCYRGVNGVMCIYTIN